MIVGAAIVPTTALLLPGVAEVLPDGVGEVATAARAALDGLRPFDVAVLLAPAADAAVHLQARTTLAGIGRPDLTVEAEVDTEAALQTAAATGWRPIRTTPAPPSAATRATPAGPPVDTAPAGEGTLPVGLAVLAALVQGACPQPGGRVVPVAVCPSAEADALLRAGGSLAGALDGRCVAVVAAGDLSAGLSPRAPLTLVEGAQAWEDEVVDVVAGGRLDRIARMGPGEAARVGALGWAPIVVLAGICRAAAIGLVVRHHAAPRGVGYLVAAGG